MKITKRNASEVGQCTCHDAMVLLFCSSPKGPPSMQLNGMAKRMQMPPHRLPQEMAPTMTPHHEEIIRFIYDRKFYMCVKISHNSQNKSSSGITHADNVKYNFRGLQYIMWGLALFPLGMESMIMHIPCLIPHSDGKSWLTCLSWQYWLGLN